MKRFRSSEDLDSFEEKGVFKDWGRRDDETSLSRSSSHRSFQYNKPENGRKGVSPSFSSRYDRLEDDRESSRSVRKRSDYEDGYDRSVRHDRYREGGERGILSSSPRSGFSGDRIHRSESFSRSPRREIPKGFRSERDRPRREASVSSWQRFGVGKDNDDSTLVGNQVGLDEKGNMRFSQKISERKSSPCSKDSGSELSKSTKMKDLESEQSKCTKKKDLESEQAKSIKKKDFESELSKSTKMRDLESEQLKSTKKKDLESEQSKSIKKKDFESEQSKSSKMKGFESEQSKSTKMKGFESEQWKRTKFKGLESEQSKSTKLIDFESEQSKSKLKDFESEQSKSTKIKVHECEQSKSTKMKSFGTEQLKRTKIKDLESEQSKSTIKKDLESEQFECTRMKDLESEQSKSTEMKDLESEQSKSTKMKDLESEQLKNIEREDPNSEKKKCGKMIKIENVGEKSGYTSEMEEGELDPDPEAIGVMMSHDMLKFEELGDNNMEEDEAKSVPSISVCKDAVGQEERQKEVKSLPESETNKDDVYEKKLKFETQKSADDLVKGSAVNEDAFEEIGEKKEENKDGLIEELAPMKEKHEQDNFVTHLCEVVDTVVTEPKRDVSEGSAVPDVALCERIYSISPSFKDKGKNVEIPMLSNHLLNFESDDIEGTSTMGLDLFINHPVKQPEKLKDEKLDFEPFDLSLSLPNVLLPIDTHNKGLAPSSPSHARSFQSFPSTFRTNSDGFTASMSFTGSQSLRHNASCSLTNNTIDFERSVSSRPLFGSASIWQCQTLNEQNQKEIPTVQNAFPKENGLPIHDQQVKVAKEIIVPSELDKQVSLHKQLSTNSRQSSGSHKTRSESSNDKNRVTRGKLSGSLYEGNNGNEEKLVKGAEFVEPIITMIVSEPVHVISKKFSHMNEQAITTLKEGVLDIVVNEDKRWQLSLFQKALVNRSEINLEMLLKANRAQLEILVALKTGVGEYLLKNQNISSSDMVEIYLNLRCRNLTCRNLLPVDECDCKVCSQKNGFCSNCMCLVCSKYDMASNTCSWVGCDVCLHWCHADCALRESFIRKGCISYGTHEVREMQFHCVACDHPSEMFGFVKEVFLTFAKGWTGEKLSKELEYVEKIFSGSDDLRGKRLHEIALFMLSRLANKSDQREVQNQIMSFFAESSSIESNDPTVRSGKALFNTNHEVNNKISGPSQDNTWLKPLHSEKTSQLEKASSFKSFVNNNNAINLDRQLSKPKEQPFDELDSIVRIKEAEAKMFQARADDARREAEGLKRISTAKNQKIEEEYGIRISKLRLLEAEEKRKNKIEELQGVEKVYREYFNMKMRMEADIRDLLSKMEASKGNLTT